MNNTLDGLRQLDQSLLFLVNQKWSHPVLDATLPVLTDLHKSLWLMPVVFALIVYLYKKSGMRGLGVLGLAFLVVGFADWFGSQVIKEYFQRLRPGASGIDVIERSPTHSGYSFMSNHATNMFALAAFLGSYNKTLAWILFPIAALIAYSRVYVGVHFPSDVLLGGLWGASLGLLFYRVLVRFKSS